MTRVLVIGGGIGGLAAALALRRAGVEVEVSEEADEYAEVGAGLLLWPNATSNLWRLGLGEGISRAGRRIERLSRHTSGGRALSAIALESFERRFGSPTICVRRSDLVALLRSALPCSAVRMGRACASIRVNENRAIALFRDGSEAEADAVIGADGIDSVVRRSLLGDEKPVHSGHAAWRGVAETEPAPLARGDFYFAWGGGTQFGAASLGEGRTYWFATENSREGAAPTPPESLLSGWGSLPAALLATTPRESRLRHGLYDRIPIAPWGRGRATLLGDAAHPMTPHLGQGACQAIEDAAILAQCIAADPDVETALRRYEARRFDRTARLVRLSRTLGSILQVESPAVNAALYLGTLLTPKWISRRSIARILEAD